MSFTLRQIRYFVAIAELGSLSSAARALNASPSAVTVGIQELEGELGCQLFERQARGMAPTVKGHQFLRHARGVLQSVADARRSLEQESTPTVGDLNLGVTTLVAGYVLAELQARYRRAFPGGEVSIIEDNREDLEHLLVGGELDAAALILPAEGHNPALQSAVIEASPYRLWLPLGHPLTKLQSVGAEALEAAPQILLATDEIAETVQVWWRSLGIRPKVVMRTHSVEAVRSLVATGAGVAVLPDLAYRPWSLEGDKVEARHLDDPVPPATVGVVWRRGAAIGPALRGFLGLVQSHAHPPRLASVE